MRILLLALFLPLVAQAEEPRVFKRTYVRAAPGVFIESGVAPGVRGPRVSEAETRPVLAEKRTAPRPDQALAASQPPQRSVQGWLTSSQ